MADKQSHIPDAEGRPQRYPTTDQPLNGPKRSNGKALLMLVAFLAVLALLYWLGVEFLVDAG